MSEAARALDDLDFRDGIAVLEDFRSGLMAGLSQAPKSIACRFLYDAAGSALFDRICETPEYYLTRTEIGILRHCAGEIARLAGPDCQLIELGSGSSLKVRILLDAMERPGAYVAIDISRDHMRIATADLARAYPGLRTIAVCADYTGAVALPVLPGRRIGFFPGSTIGNLTPEEARILLSLWATELGPDAALIVGVDLKKSPAELDAAYNDAAGVTAAFTKNILTRANRELGTNFVTGGFAHEASYVPKRGCVEIYLRSLVAQKINFSGQMFEFAAGERIHVENSFKYGIEEFQALAADAGFAPSAVWTDEAGRFSVHYLTTARKDAP